MRESSPASGGIIIGIAVMGSLAYALGYGGQMADLAGGALGLVLERAADVLAAAGDAIRAWS